jgi:arsenate reductase (glutaredoxin)
VGGPSDVTIWHNPRCSKSRGALALLTELGIEPTVVRYLEAAPSRAQLEDVLRRLGTDDPRSIMRTGESLYRELGLAGANREALLDALAANPSLIERPIVLVGDRAVVGRPPERVRELFSPGS